MQKRHSSRRGILSMLSVISEMGVERPFRQDETFHQTSVFLVVYSHRSTWPK